MTHSNKNCPVADGPVDRGRGLGRTALDADIATLALNAVAVLVSRSEKTWGRARISRALLEYRCFLQLVRDFPDRPIVPSPDADVVWHAALLDLGPYLAACDALFGRPLIHFPWAGSRGAADAALQRARFAESSSLLDLLVTRVLSTYSTNLSEGVEP